MNKHTALQIWQSRVEDFVSVRELFDNELMLVFWPSRDCTCSPSRDWLWHRVARPVPVPNRLNFLNPERRVSTMIRRSRAMFDGFIIITVLAH